MSDERIKNGNFSIEVNEETYELTKSHYTSLIFNGKAICNKALGTDFSVLLKESNIKIMGYSKFYINPKTLVFQGSEDKLESEIKSWERLVLDIRGEKYRKGSLKSMMINIFGVDEWDAFIKKNKEGNE